MTQLGKKKLIDLFGIHFILKRIDYSIIGIVSIFTIFFHLLFWSHFFNPDFGADQRLYWNQGLFLYKDFNFLFNPAFGLYEPFIPFMIYLFLNIFGESYVPIICYNIFVYTVMLCFIYLFSKDIFASRFWAIVTLLFVISNNTYIQFNFLVARETSTVALLTLFCIGFYYYFKKPDKWLFLLLSLLGSIALLNDNRYYPYFFLFIITWGIFDLIKYKSVNKLFIYLLLVFLFLLPWSIRNYKVNGYFLPLSGARLSQYLSFLPENSLLVKDKEKLLLWSKNADRVGFNADSSLLNLPPIPEVKGYERGSDYHSKVSEQEYNNMYRQRATSFVGTRIDYLIFFWKFYQNKYEIGPGYDDRIYPPYSLIRNINEITHTGFLLPFFFLAIWFAIKRKKNIIIILTAIVLFHTFLHVIPGSHLIRYRYQVMPIFTFVSVYGIKFIIDPLIKRLPFYRK